MRFRRLQSDETAVSAVIGTVLLVGIATITMAILAAAILGVGLFEQPPDAELVYQEDEDGTVAIGLIDVRGLTADNTEIRLEGEGSCGNWDGSGDLERGDVTVVDGVDCSEPLEENDVLQVIGSNLLLGTYELRGRAYNCDAFTGAFNDGSEITVDRGEPVSCDFVDTDGGRLDNQLEINNETKLIGDVNVTQSVDLKDGDIVGDIDTDDLLTLRDGSDIDGSVRSGPSKDVILEVETGETSTITGDIEGGRDAIIKDDNVVEGSVTVDRNVEIKDGGEIGGSIDAGRQVTLKSNSYVGGPIDADDDVTVEQNGFVDDSIDTAGNDVTLEEDATVTGDVTADSITCSSGATIDGEDCDDYAS
ncbi:polymer-forming cytoskeletal protein [Natrinema amylolyticum]|uniref:polymer-forming cytoskeletal protein n=1 Tax=Natrinema amylolyticum TaxID=2878679 RepID=UPI001CF9CDB0|nr:polymer-forming cytoskeletal protein [Natrinema amylolyticum]